MTKMSLNSYQDNALTTAIYPGRKEIGGLTYAVLGLIGEVAEVIELWDIGEYHRDQDNLEEELGDIAWYFSAVADELNFRLDEVDEIGFSMSLKTSPYMEDAALLRMTTATGSLGNILKKALRDDDGEITKVRKAKLITALAMAWVWYTTLIEFRNASGMKMSLQTVLEKNLDKLFSRKERGVLTGDGGER